MVARSPVILGGNRSRLWGAQSPSYFQAEEPRVAGGGQYIGQRTEEEQKERKYKMGRSGAGLLRTRARRPGVTAKAALLLGRFVTAS